MNQELLEAVLIRFLEKNWCGILKKYISFRKRFICLK